MGTRQCEPAIRIQIVFISYPLYVPRPPKTSTTLAGDNKNTLLVEECVQEQALMCNKHWRRWAKATPSFRLLRHAAKLIRYGAAQIASKRAHHAPEKQSDGMESPGRCPRAVICAGGTRVQA